jgi:hypothetical protein
MSQYEVFYVKGPGEVKRFLTHSEDEAKNLWKALIPTEEGKNSFKEGPLEYEILFGKVQVQSGNLGKSNEKGTKDVGSNSSRIEWIGSLILSKFQVINLFPHKFLQEGSEGVPGIYSCD